jgi:hypothetical protein
VTLRPGTRAAFSTNFFHDTWHVVTDLQGSRLRARLLWGLSYQRQPGTLLLIHAPHLRPTPFEAERSDPFLLIPAGLTGLDAQTLRRLKALLPRLGRPSKTVRWLTSGWISRFGIGRIRIPPARENPIGKHSDSGTTASSGVPSGRAAAAYSSGQATSFVELPVARTQRAE